MRKTLVLVLLLAAANAVAIEKYSVVAVSGFDRKQDYWMMDAVELKDMKANISAESLFFSRAVSAAKREWAGDPAKKGKQFPMMAKRSMRVVQTFSKREDATEKLSSYVPKGAQSSKSKKESVDPKKALMADAMQLVATHLGKVSEGRASGATIGLPAVAESSPSAKTGGRPPLAAAKGFSFTVTATIYYNIGIDGFSMIYAPGTLLNGREPLGFKIPLADAAKFGVTKEWDGRKVTISGIADLEDKGRNVKFKNSKAKTISSIRPLSD